MIPLLIVAASFATQLSQSAWTKFTPGPLPIENPLKGYAAYLDAAPQLSGYASMAYVSAPWSELEPLEGQYRFDRLDAHFERPLSKGKDIVLRIWLDYPTMPSGVPDWLRAKGLKMTRYPDFGGGLSPDYENEDLRKGLQHFIAALGKRYGDGKRVRFIEVGFLGHWGEWHTYPRDELFAKPATQRLVVESLHRAFPEIGLLGRNPTYPSLQLPWMGFHDDLIPDDTDSGPDWNFLPQLAAGGMANNWKVAPTGGEMVPANAKRLLSTDWEKLTSAVRKCHFSFIAGYCPVLEQNVDPQFRQRSDELAQLLGYSYRLDQARLPGSATRSQPSTYEIEGENVGVAPFYYRWPVCLALLRTDGTEVERVKLDDDVRSWLPGKFSLVGNATWRAAPGKYDLAIGIVDPTTSQPRIQFANRLPTVHGWTILSRDVQLSD